MFRPKVLPFSGEKTAQSLIEDSQERLRQLCPRSIVVAPARKVRSVAASPFDGEGSVHSVTIAAGDDVTIQHHLGRVPRGWIICRTRADGAINAMVRETAQSTTTITLDNPSGAEVRLTVWVF